MTGNCGRIGGRVVLGLLASLADASAQPPPERPGPPPPFPLRLGLWEQHHTQTLNGMQFPVPPMVIDEARRRGVAMSSDGLSERFCLTADNISSLGLPTATALPTCRKEKIDIGDIGMNVILACSDQTGSGRGSVGIAFDSPTAYHGRFAFTGTHNLFGGLPIAVQGPVTGRWLQADCRTQPP